MADRRMFSLDIVDTDAFLEMPQSSQLLYYHLAMRADDEGFVSSPKRIMKMIGSSEDDYKVLCAKKFIIPFESGICVIKHWLIHNTIRMDRFKATTYINEKAQLYLKDNKAYKITEITENKEIDTKWQPNGNQMATQVKLSQVKLSKDSIVVNDTPFSLKDEIQKLYDNKRRDLNIIGLFFEYRNPNFENREQYLIAIKRHLKAAGDLKAFSDDQIIKAIEYAKKEYKDIYTLETLLKILTK